MTRLDPSLTSVALLAAVDILALLGGFIFVWRALKRLKQFAGAARRDSIEIALRHVRHVSCRQAMRCAQDQSYYLSRLALLFVANLISTTGLLFAAVCLADEGPVAGGSSLWTGFASLSLLIFAVLSIRSFYRTSRLARQVLQIRRKIRSVEARKRRLALGAGHVRVPTPRLGLVQP